MILSELQENLIEVLKHLNVPLNVAFPVMLYLETEEQQAQLGRFLLDNLERKPTGEEILRKACEILNSSL